MAATKNYSATRDDLATLFGAPAGRGLMMNNEQVEFIQITKATGDTSGTITLSAVQIPTKAIAIPKRDSAGSAVNTFTSDELTITMTGTPYSVTLGGMADWTVADVFITGRAFD